MADVFDRPASRRRLFTVAGAGLALGALAACGSSSVDEGNGVAKVGQRPGGYLAGTQIEGGQKLPDLKLTDTHGKPFSLASDITTPVVLLFFGYTNCPDICPGILADLASARQRAGDDVAKQTTVVLVSTDPPRDTPAVMKAYLERIDPGFIGLTGDLEAIKAAGMTLGITMEQTSQLPSGGYEITHGTQVYGFGKDRTAQVLWSQGTSIGDYKADIANLVTKQETPR
ncbi:SCO family protein [Propionibacteriaceae bacterium G1746]|uniref:SCO family protein n=1 Tax=Aestuariimicrobium sp. G57 TaxID=3418485 RepID=UPI003C2476CB